MRLLFLIFAMALSALAAPAQHLALHLPQAELDALPSEARQHFEVAKRLGDRMQYLEAVAHLDRAASICPDSIALQRLTASAAEERVGRVPRAEGLALSQGAMQAHLRIIENPLATDLDRQRSQEALERLEARFEELRDPPDRRPRRLERAISGVNHQRREIQEATQDVGLNVDQAIFQADAANRPRPDAPSVGSSRRPTSSAPIPLENVIPTEPKIPAGQSGTTVP